MIHRFARTARRVAVFALTGTALVLVGCGGSDAEAAKQPLGGGPREALSADARAAIDAGNAAYRAGKFDEAIAQYRTAAAAAPDNAAPWYGVLMAAQRTGNTALADSATKAVERLSGATGTLTDETMQKVHQGGAFEMPPNHPPTEGPDAKRPRGSGAGLAHPPIPPAPRAGT
jgi:hypothetical protein